MFVRKRRRCVQGAFSLLDLYQHESFKGKARLLRKRMVDFFVGGKTTFRVI
jgi:hypothetical protein